MIEAIREIGEYALKKEGKSTDNPLDILIDNPSNRQTENVLFIKINEQNGKFDYDGITIEPFDIARLKKYLFRRVTGNTAAFTPTVITDKNIANTFTHKLLKSLKSLAKEKNEFITKIFNVLKNQSSIIIEDLQKKYSKKNNILSLKIDGKYVGEYEQFRKILLEKAKQDYYYKSSFTTGKYSIAKDKLCVVCNENKAEVYGFVSTFKFYTVDKQGFVSGGFRQSDAWKNYPVCLECALILEEGKRFLDEHLNFNFYGHKYLLIPKFLVSTTEDEKEEVFSIFEEQKNPEIREKIIRRITNDENEILELTGEFKNYLNLNFLFYEKNNSAFNILQYIEDVLPSRIKRIFDVKSELDEIPIFKNYFVPVFEGNKKTGEKPLEFNFGILRNFFYNSVERNPVSDKYFLDAVNKIFSSRPVDYDFILSFIIEKIRTDFAQGYSTTGNTLKGFMLLNFLKKLDLIEISKGDRKMEGTSNTENNSKLRKKVVEFFNEFSEFFNTAAKKAIFLEGVLAQFLLNIQYAEKNSQPFRARLKGLKMDKKLIEKLLPEIQNKLEEYGKNYYRELEEIISEYLVASGPKWNLSNDEISYYFVLGMNLSKNFKKDNEGENENGND